VTNGYDRRGRLAVITNGPAVTTLTLNDAGETLTESYNGGPLNGLSVTNGFDSLLRRISVTVLNGSSVLARTTNSYDAASRLSTVSDGANAAAYSYLANSPLVDHIVFANSGATVMTNQNSYDYLNRLTAISSGGASSTSPISFQYAYNAANQRTKVTLMDGSYWSYGYDALGQLTASSKYFPDGTARLGQLFNYTFDTIGNRTLTQAGGNYPGTPLRVSSYTNNALNQIVSRGVPGAVDVMGLTLATNFVKVNGSNAYQNLDYFREQIAVNNTSASLWTNMTVSAPGQATVSGHVFVAKNPEKYTYDADGNLTSDGRWTNIWDGENRLINITSLATTPTASQYSLALTYDYMGRRIQKIVSTNNGSAWVVSYTNRFVYDGWNVVAILDGANNLLTTFTWGLDLSGSPQGAGGVGGLISMTVHSGPNAGTYFYCYDGNGNVVALVNAANGSLAQTYEYDPFGQITRSSGYLGNLNPFLFSTKYYDWETGLYYYGYRYYNPSTGRWPNRDPIRELGFEIVSQRPKTTQEKYMDEFREVLELIHEIAPSADRPILIDKVKNRFVQMGVNVWKPTGTENPYNFLYNDSLDFQDSYGLSASSGFTCDTTLIKAAHDLCLCALWGRNHVIATTCIGCDRTCEAWCMTQYLDNTITEEQLKLCTADCLRRMAKCAVSRCDLTFN
jgi:RHS repeat-associated protein